MKKDKHPKYGFVLFKDIQTGDQWVGRSTKLDGPEEVVDGVSCRVVSLEISSHSHPFYSGKSTLVDAAGRVDRFKKRFGGAAMVSKKKAAKTAAGSGEGA